MPISANMRAAAAEMWCRLLASQSTDPCAGLAPAGRLLALESAALPIELRAELIRSLGRWIPPGHMIPGLDEALDVSEGGRRGDVSLRRAAIDACLLQALWHADGENASPQKFPDEPAVTGFDESDWPSSIANCELDPDSSVRCTFGQWLAAVKHPRAVEVLKRQIDDSDPHVRDSALVSLGLLGTEAAREELAAQARDGKPWVRHIAVRALARWGVDEILPWATDSESLVRVTVAEELGGFPGIPAGVALQRLVVDENPQVQLMAAEAVADWPPQLAAPVSFHGFRDGSPRTRHICRLQLQSMSGGELVAVATGTREERTTAAARLARPANLPLTYAGNSRRERSKLLGPPGRDESDRGEPLWNQITSARVGSSAYRAALDALSSLPAAEQRSLEERFLASRGELSAARRRDLARILSPAYAAVQDLDSKDVEVRRRAARRLAAYGTASSLHPSIVREVRDRLIDEQDRAVWQSAMDAVGRDATDESAQIALLAVNHVWPDIRILGCQYLGRHGRPEYASWLVPLFEDDNRNVQVEAVSAVGQCHNPLVLSPPSAGQPGDSPPIGLRQLLSHPDSRLRFAAIVAASRLGDRAAMEQLTALSRSEDAAVREDAIRAMGESGQSRFVGEIVRLAWTEPSDAVQRAMLDSLNQLIPSGERPLGLADGGSYDDKIILWVRWWDGRRGPSSTVPDTQNESFSDDRIP